MKSEIVEKARRFMEITGTRDSSVISDFIGYEIRRRRLETARKKGIDRLRIGCIVRNVLNSKIAPDFRIQRYFWDALVGEGLAENCEVRYKIGAEIVDFAFLNLKIAVECDTYQWQKYDGEYIERDQERDRYLARKGWIVLHLGRNEIVADIEGCIGKIRELEEVLYG